MPLGSTLHVPLLLLQMYLVVAADGDDFFKVKGKTMASINTTTPIGIPMVIHLDTGIFFFYLKHTQKNQKLMVVL